MGRAVVAVLAALLAASAAPARAAEKPLLLSSAVPPALLALETKADALQITSARVSLSTSLRLGSASKGLRELARLFEVKLEGVETTSPPAAAFSVTLLGGHFRMRIAGGHVYLFAWTLAAHDGGRPWIELEHGAVGRLFGTVGKEPREADSSGAKRYAKLFTLVNDGAGIHELPQSTLFGQALTGFEEEVEPKAASEGTGSGGGLGGFAAARRRHRPLPRPKPRLSIYFAASGAVVRVQVQTGDAKAGATVTADFPAIDFPYTIPPPPPSHVISERELVRRIGSHRRPRGTAQGRGQGSSRNG